GNLEDLLKVNEKDSDVLLARAELDVITGNYKRARETYDAVIAADEKAENLRAWGMRSIVLRIQGDRETLKTTATYCFDLFDKKKDYFNSETVKDPRELAYIALGVQDEDPKSAFETGYMLAEDLVKTRGLSAPDVYIWSGKLAFEKYAFPLAQERFAQALKLRPRYPDALAGTAAVVLTTQHNLEAVEKLLTEALSVNPNHIESNLISAQVDLEEDRYKEAKEKIDRALAVNPNHMEALAMLAFWHIDMAEPEKAAEAEKRALAINPKSADFFCEIGNLMESKRGFNTAPEYYKKAIQADPESWRGYYDLGMNTSRQGGHGEEEGKALLLKAFEKNKFNLWASNMIKVLDKMIGDKIQDVKPVYSEYRSANFILKFHGKETNIVRPYLEEWAEGAYKAQVEKFGFKPEGPLTITLCYSFQDQAARTVGLPNLGALGVCFGKLSTVVSPREGKKGGQHGPFNWKKVLEHEFAHVMALQMSKYRVPRWFTEALSTYVENDSRIQSDQMMIDYIKKNKLLPLKDINKYFRTNMLMPYVHGRYIIEYIANNYGFDAIKKALVMFGEGKKLDEVLPAVTGKSMDELNDGQLQFLLKSFEKVRLRPTFDPPTLIQLELAAKKADATAQNLADFSIAQLSLNRKKAAEELANKALEKDPNCADAINVLGIMAYDRKNFEGAKQLFLKSTGIDPERSFTAWHRLGIIYKKEGRTTKAVEAFENARSKYPRYVGPDNPHHELPELYAEMETPQMDKALQVWKDAVAINSEDPEAAMKGLKLAMSLKDYKAATEFANAHFAIDPYNAEIHRLCAQAYELLKDEEKALREFSVAVAVDEKDVESWVGAARILRNKKMLEEARASLRAALEVDGTHVEAKKMLQELQ
ncbi:MAG TPA: tetratricopeptide repeat protein, partial [Planctomycetota bacterium]|nr:tetratricopeptide repeat protein [Planctomycetota bacterium]